MKTILSVCFNLFCMYLVGRFAYLSGWHRRSSFYHLSAIRAMDQGPPSRDDVVGYAGWLRAFDQMKDAEACIPKPGAWDAWWPRESRLLASADERAIEQIIRETAS